MSKAPWKRTDDKLRAAVLAACRALVADGIRPSATAILDLVPGHSGSTLIKIRDELLAAGELSIEGTKPKRDGRPGEWDESAAIVARREEAYQAKDRAYRASIEAAYVTPRGRYVGPSIPELAAAWSFLE